ncbi:MAG: hypothetical protein ACM31C_03760 [Acidobacteriota bacterium]
MWRSFVGLALVVVIGGCNAILGIHDLAPDAGAGGPDADPCTGTCECKLDTDCGTHQVCVDMVTSRTCQCAAGYTKDTTGACAWSGVVANPGFTTTQAWTLVGTTTIDTAFAGQVDPGAAQITDPACTSDSGVTQQVMMPRLSRAEPLVTVATYEGSINKPQQQIAATVGIGPIWHQGPLSFFGFVSMRACLGPAQYAPESSRGPGAMVPVAAYDFDQFCGFQDALSLDHVDILPAMAGECPDPGTALNGDAEGTTGWLFATSTSTANDGTFAGYVANRGYNNSQGIRLYATQRCDYASATDQVSIPLADATGSPVLSVYHSTSASYLSIQLDGKLLALSGGNAPTIERYCIPAYMRGGVFQLLASVTPGGSGTCTDPFSDEAIVDEITLGNDPACGSDPAIADGGFESGLSLVGVSSGYGGTVGVVADAVAHGGAHDLQLRVAQICGAAGLQDPVVIPAGTASAGPAVAFWYRFPQGNNTGFFVPSYKGTFTPVRDGSWHQGIACLDPNQTGRPAAFSMFLDSNVSGTCGTAFAAETIALDDVSVTTDPSCPTM